MKFSILEYLCWKLQRAEDKYRLCFNIFVCIIFWSVFKMRLSYKILFSCFIETCSWINYLGNIEIQLFVLSKLWLKMILIPWTEYWFYKTTTYFWLYIFFWPFLLHIMNVLSFCLISSRWVFHYYRKSFRCLMGKGCVVIIKRFKLN